MCATLSNFCHDLIKIEPRLRMGRSSRASTEERDEEGGAEVRLVMAMVVMVTVMVMVVIMLMVVVVKISQSRG